MSALAVMDDLVNRTDLKLGQGFADQVRTARADVDESLSLLRAFVANIDEWEGEPAPGDRWHKEYFRAKALIARQGGPV